MQIIPAIDLMGGRVVRARFGDRSRYRPLRSALCDSSEPALVVDALMRLHPFDVMYFADLDAILSRGDHKMVIKSIRHRHPRLRIWLDAGMRDASSPARRRQADDHEHLVIGSESLSDIDVLRRLHSRAPPFEAYTVLSLDFHGQTLVGATPLLDTPGEWPERVIIMTLSCVGSLAGPDLDLLRRVVALSPTTTWYAGGGVRHADDLRNLADIGMRGALVASALHNGAIGASTIAGCASHLRCG